MLGFILKKFDLFGHPPSLYIKKQNIYPTYLGGFMSIVLMGITIGLMVHYGIELFNHKNPFLMSVIRPVGTTEVELNSSNMFIGFVMYSKNKTPLHFNSSYWLAYSFKGVTKDGMFDINNSINETDIIVNCTVPDFDISNCIDPIDYQLNRTLCDNKAKEIKEREKALEEKLKDPTIILGVKCTLEMLKGFEGLSNETINLLISEGLCLDFRNLTLNSTNFNKTISRIKIDFFLNLHHSFGSPNYVEQYLSFLPISLIMFYQTNTYSPDNFENPFRKTLSSNTYVFYNLTYHILQAEITEINSITKSGLVFSSTDTKTETRLGFINYFYRQTTSNANDAPKFQFYRPIFDLTLNLNQEVTTNIREYTTLLDTLSELGGVLNLFLIFFRIISTYVGDFEIIFYLFSNYYRQKNKKNTIKINSSISKSNLNETKGKNQTTISSTIINANLTKSINCLNELSPKSPTTNDKKNLKANKYTRWNIIRNHYLKYQNSKQILPIDPILLLKETLSIEKFIEMKEEYHLLKYMVLSKEKLKEMNKLALRFRSDGFIDNYLLKEPNDNSSYLSNNYLEKSCSINKK